MICDAYTEGQTLLKVENLSVSYDGKPVLKNVNSEIKKISRADGQVTGQIIAVLGPSGIGKTQLFRNIAGLNRPNSGRVTINGQNRPVEPGEVGVVAQNYPLFEHRTVYSNLLLAACQREKDHQVARDRVIAYLHDFDLADKHDLYPKQLSGGQRQRVAIIQQTLCSEHFLLMDEPFSGLDPIMESKTCELLGKIAKTDGSNTVIVTTHDITAAATIADHIWLIGRDGPVGNKTPGAYIVEQIKLIDQGLCWHPELVYTSVFADFVRGIRERFRNL
jgi:ABC-type nitrate/sulfonate/bicarbonate transport system ATPase subunit